MKYYYTDGVNKYGPMSVEQMLINDINADTMVWADGMAEWQRAGDVDELAEALKSVPPPIPKPEVEPEPEKVTPPPPPARPKSWLVESILITLLCCLPLGIVSIVYSLKVEDRYNRGDYKGAVAASNEAGKWCKWALIITATCILLYILLVVLMGLGIGAIAISESVVQCPISLDI